MAITAANKTSGKDEADLSTYTTASVAFVANRLYLFTYGSHGPAPTVATANGTGLTIEQVNTVTNASTKRLTVFRALPGADTTTTVNFVQSASQVQSHGFWAIDEYQGMEPGANGLTAVVQAANNQTAGATSLTVTLAAFGSVNNAAYGAFLRSENENMTEGAGFTALAEVTGASSPTTSILTENKLNDNTVDCSWASSGAGFGIGIEVKAAVAGGETVLDPFGMTGFFGS